MEKIISILVIVLAFITTSNAQNQMKKDALIQSDTVKTIRLEQTKSEFTQKKVTVPEGNYVFEIANNNVGKDVGFVLVQKGKEASKPENHIKNAYVTQVLKDGKKETSKTTTLSKGEYVYFCPLNETPQYTLIVK